MKHVSTFAFPKRYGNDDSLKDTLVRVMCIQRIELCVLLFSREALKMGGIYTTHSIDIERIV